MDELSSNMKKWKWKYLVSIDHSASHTIPITFLGKNCVLIPENDKIFEQLFRKLLHLSYDVGMSFEYPLKIVTFSNIEITWCQILLYRFWYTFLVNLCSYIIFMTYTNNGLVVEKLLNFNVQLLLNPGILPMDSPK